MDRHRVKLCHSGELSVAPVHFFGPGRWKHDWSEVHQHSQRACVTTVGGDAAEEHFSVPTRQCPVAYFWDCQAVLSRKRA